MRVRLNSLFLVCVWLMLVGPSLATATENTADVRQPLILILGDSLSAAYGIDQRDGWVSLLQQRLRQRGLPHQVFNASVSGETSSGGLRRIGPVLAQQKPDIVVIELGANDGLRGLPIAEMRGNLGKIIQRSQQAGARVLLVGMRLPPNYGFRYTKQFEESYTQLARDHAVGLSPFLLKGMATDLSQMQADGLHPTAEAQPRLLENVWEYLRPLLE
ncbi:MAG: arylesterase [Gammaproteobacteria bacterium]|nr:arylesterase [Gammaproteobacteria bacterium]